MTAKPDADPMPPDPPLPIEHYAIISDCTTAALVGLNGSIDWLCLPRFDSAACFAALLGNSDHGRWRIRPADPGARSTRQYRDGSLVLETVFDTQDGRVALIDFMPTNRGNSAIIRIVEGRSGTVAMRLDLTLRFDYGASVPWVERLPDGSGISAIVGPDRVVLRTPVELVGEDHRTGADFALREGERVAFVLSHAASHLPIEPPIDAVRAWQETEAAWQEWSGRCAYRGPFQAQVKRSLLTLKALASAATGGIVAAPTTSLPEQLGGGRNWDYRFCWLRDAALTLLAMMSGGYTDDAQAWRNWLQRSVAGSPEQLQIMYGLAGERRLPEFEVPWLPGYQGAAPVRVGNAAAGQLQLDVYGEVVAALHQGRRMGLESPPSAWSLQRALVEHLDRIWQEPDEGIWEVRGGRRHFTFSKVMAWVAFDRSIKDCETYGLVAPLDRWRQTRDRIHATICDQGFDTQRNSFMQSFGSDALDASLLLMPRTGFLPVDDPRVAGTIAAIEQDLLVDGWVLRYRTEAGADGLPAGEGAFLACSFWLADAFSLQGRHAEARALFERLLALANDVGLLSEEYDPRQKRLVGNFPQAFSHVALIATAIRLQEAETQG